METFYRMQVEDLLLWDRCQHHQLPEVKDSPDSKWFMALKYLCQARGKQRSTFMRLSSHRRTANFRTLRLWSRTSWTMVHNSNHNYLGAVPLRLGSKSLILHNHYRKMPNSLHDLSRKSSKSSKLLVLALLESWDRFASAPLLTEYLPSNQSR